MLPVHRPPRLVLHVALSLPIATCRRDRRRYTSLETVTKRFFGYTTYLVEVLSFDIQFLFRMEELCHRYRRRKLRGLSLLPTGDVDVDDSNGPCPWEEWLSSCCFGRSGLHTLDSLILAIVREICSDTYTAMVVRSSSSYLAT